MKKWGMRQVFEDRRVCISRKESGRSGEKNGVSQGEEGGRCQACREDFEWKAQVKREHTPCLTCSSMKPDSEVYQ